MKKGGLVRLLPRRLLKDDFQRYLQRVRHPIWMGNLRRKVPVTRWGWDRGTPIDRFYIEEFLEENRGDIAGRVLEVRDARYCTRFGQPGTRADVLDMNPRNPAATIVADLSAADNIPSETFDCFILTQTLQYIYRCEAAVGHACRILKPGGVLLATVPVLQAVDTGHPDLWRFTQVACKEMFGRYFGAGDLEIKTYGNALAGVAFLSGLAAEEFKLPELKARSADYPVIVAIRAQKSV